MAVLKCKMCGGDLNVVAGQTVCECDYCGSKQTVPTLDNEKKPTLFSRANRLRALGEFDKAYNVYESIVSEFPEEAEAYWGLVLCKYGIEYVDDPATGKKIPTCHRSSFDSVMENDDFGMVMEYADTLARTVYRTEAKEIERLRSGILEVSAKEQPYDIFICYKETDENGSRTIDSVIAQDVYTALTEKGYRVFFSRITLEDKLGQEYEPYIFAALHSAKIMLVFGTDYDYFNAVWVKNEWSRYLALIAKGEKKTLIPCYKDVDAYDLPQEFRRLQAQDMGKVGAIQDLLRGIEKILPLQKPEPVKETVRETAKETVVVQQVSSPQGSTVDSLLKRAFMFLEDGDWDSADEYCEKVLDIDPENGEAYLGKLLSRCKIGSIEDLPGYTDRMDDDISYKKAIRFGTPEVNKLLTQINRRNVERIRNDWEQQQKQQTEEVYRQALKLMEAHSRDGYEAAKELLSSISGYSDADDMIKKCEDAISELQASFERVIMLLYFDPADGTKRKPLRLNGIPMIAVDDNLIVCLKDDGTVAIWPKREKPKYTSSVSDWKDIVTVYAYHWTLYGIKEDGTVIAASEFDSDRNTFADCTDMAAISYALGLKTDGTVVNKGGPHMDIVAEWKDVVEIYSGIYTGTVGAIGLHADGTMISYVQNDMFGEGDVSGWEDVISFAAGSDQTVVLFSDGSVGRRGRQVDPHTKKRWDHLYEMKDLIAIAAGVDYVVGLKADGTVTASGAGWFEEEAYGWKDIIAIAANESRVAGLKADGTVVTRGRYNDRSSPDIRLFDGILSFEKILQQRIQEERERKRKKLTDQLVAAKQRKQAAETELANLKGLFTGKRRRELEAQIAEDGKTIERLQNELKALES